MLVSISDQLRFSADKMAPFVKAWKDMPANEIALLKNMGTSF